MTKIFIGGSRQVSRLNSQIRARIDNIVSRNLPIVIGDANGVDKAVQSYLRSMGYLNVEVFCSAGFCRNNVGDWEIRSISAGTRQRKADFYAAKDRVMTREADIGLMIWDGKSVGTLLNAIRLVSMNKIVVMYVVPDRKFWEIRGRDELESFLACCDSKVRRAAELRAERENLPSSIESHDTSQETLPLA